MGPYTQKRHLGQCTYCGNKWLEHEPCKQCECDMVLLLDRSQGDPHFRGVQVTDFLVCEKQHCNNIKKCKTSNTTCSKCMDESGIKSNMVFPNEEELLMIKHQKYLPRCALLALNKCMECLDTATYLERQLPRPIMMASSILKLTREYDALVETGFRVNFDINKNTKTKMLLEPTFLDISPKKLRTLVEHHHKMCLCSICKWWIIGNHKQDEL